MKIYKKILHYWIAIASALSFLGGWVILAHSPKPILTTSTQSSGFSLPTLAPLPDLGNLNSSPNPSLNNPQANPGNNPGLPLLITRGS